MGPDETRGVRGEGQVPAGERQAQTGFAGADMGELQGPAQFAEAVATGVTLTVDQLALHVTFACCADSPILGQTSRRPGVWVEAGDCSGNEAKLQIVTAVPSFDVQDLRLALSELWEAIDRDSDREGLLREIAEARQQKSVIALDLVWEANAPLTKVLSPASERLSFIGTEVTTTGLAEEIRGIFTRVLVGQEGKRLGDDGIGENEFLAAVENQILVACDEKLSSGRDTVLVAASNSDDISLASDLPKRLVGAMYEQFRGKRVLLMSDPTE